MYKIIIFTCDEFKSFDWRPHTHRLPRGAVIAAINYVAEPGEVNYDKCRLEMIADVNEENRQSIIVCSNSACEELARFETYAQS